MAKTEDSSDVVVIRNVDILGVFKVIEVNDLAGMI
jgi:hypothetical protein